MGPFEARLASNSDGDGEGNQYWQVKLLEQSTYEKVTTLLNEGLSQKEIANELNIHKSTVCRHVKNAKTLGALKANPSGDHL